MTDFMNNRTIVGTILELSDVYGKKPCPYIKPFLAHPERNQLKHRNYNRRQK